ncbi:MAG: RICIN domain-containing protein [Chitinispirillales bacterium]|jgi:hypothetical protein|nr:RICIN domain-containing protein [Chitinispirillales bacterium]
MEEIFKGLSDKINNDPSKFIPEGALSNIPVIVDGARYYIRNWESSKVMDVEGGSKGDYTKVILYDNGTGDNQKWVAVASKSSPGFFSFRAVHSSKYLDVKGCNVKNELIQYHGNGSEAQLFTVQETGDKNAAGERAVYLVSVIDYKPNSTQNYRISTWDKVHKNGSWLCLNTDTSNRSKWKFVSAG